MEKQTLYSHGTIGLAVARDSHGWVMFPYNDPNGWGARRPYLGSTESLKPLSGTISDIARRVAKFPY